MTTEKPNAHAALNTSEGGRRFLADFFATELRRHDFAHYISTRLAADFACALAQHLAGRQPVVQEPVIVEAVATIKFDDDQEPYIDWVVEGGIHALPVGDVLISASGTTITDEEGYGEVYAAPPAQGIDLHRLVPPEWISEQIGGPIDDLTPGQAWRQGFNQCRTRALLLVEQALGFPGGHQLDAATGVGNG